MSKTIRPPGNRTVIYGVHPVVETLRARRRPIDEIYLAREPVPTTDLGRVIADTKVPARIVSGAQLVAIAGSPHHQGVAARTGPFPYVDLEEILTLISPSRQTLLLMDEIQDPANFGSILRSAECLAACGVVLTRDRCVPVTAAVEKASAGASAHVVVARVVNLVRTMEELKSKGFWIYATEMRGAQTCYETDLKGQIALVLGSEGKGLRRLVRERCDGSVSIPMTGKIGSLNVAQTAAILLAEAHRQRLTFCRTLSGEG